MLLLSHSGARSSRGVYLLLWLFLGQMLLVSAVLAAENLSKEQLSKRVVPPYQLGKLIENENIWTLMNLDGAVAGYMFETEPLAPIPGFSGQPINLLVSMTVEGKLLKVELLHHNEPIFVSGLGQLPFDQFVTQYDGLSIKDSLSVGVPYGSVDGASTQKYLDGVTKATASVRIAHESILAAAYSVARKKMGGISTGQAPEPALDYREPLTFEQLVAEGIAKQFVVSNAEVQALFEDSEWETDDPEGLENPDQPFLDLWIIDLAPPSVAKTVLDADSLEKLNYFLSISPENEPILLIENGRHGLVSEQFVRNTEPDLIAASQDGLPIA